MSSIMCWPEHDILISLIVVSELRRRRGIITTFTIVVVAAVGIECSCRDLVHIP